ncbi:MAG: superoxide dismutase [Gammaproteobacteria bacterium]|nr:superoxide dismutase [Gammaproteobacteria bacterium]
MPFELPPLPYGATALQPHISARTLEYHHGKHHRGYVEKLNAVIEGTDYAGKSLEEIVVDAATAGNIPVFNNAAQAWNHEFLWQSMTPGGGGQPGGTLATLIDRSFGGYDSFREMFMKTAMGQFGSGWAWLVKDTKDLQIISTANAGNPLVDGKPPLLTLDVWEHAYYLDYQNARGKYVDTFLDELVNWNFAAANLAALGEAE